MIAEVAESIMYQYNNDASLQDALSGGLYFQQARQEETFPYGVFYINGITQDEIMGGADDKITMIDLQFNIFSDDQDGGVTIATTTDVLTAAYDWKVMTVADFNCVMMQRESVMPILYIDNIWQATINYTLGIQKEVIV